MDQPDPTADLSFEAALKRLEEIVRTLEQGEAPLDQSIELYQEGDKLKRHCEARLEGRPGADRADRLRRRRKAVRGDPLRCRLSW